MVTDGLAVTGSGGFLGWHTMVRAHATGRKAEAVDLRGPRPDLGGAQRVLHLAGVNRGSADEVLRGNVAAAEALAAAVRAAVPPPATIVFANSVHAGADTPYGAGKRRAAEILAAATADVGAAFVDLALPNLFGEHGRPFYNAVTATFCHLLARGEEPVVAQDRELSLLHAQDAAAVLVGEAGQAAIGQRRHRIGVAQLRERLAGFATAYATGTVPALHTPFDVALFNTYRSYTRVGARPLTPHRDGRGSFHEVVRCLGGPGQSSFSTTVPGVTRGDHFHLAKVERFAVLAGRARIALRKVLTGEVVHVDVDGAEPAFVDMPTMWAHNITNTGDGELHTLFWTNDLFDPAAPDTYPEPV